MGGDTFLPPGAADADNDGIDDVLEYYYHGDLETVPCTLNFTACLYMAGDKLQAEAVPMFEVKDVADNPFTTGDYDEFKLEYDSNPDILIEDISEFLQAIDKLENLMKQLSIDNNQRDPDTEFC